MIKYLIPTTSKYYLNLFRDGVKPIDFVSQRIMFKETEKHYEELGFYKDWYKLREPESEYADKNGYVYFEDQSSLDEYLNLMGRHERISE
jgi:hypothetical protein